MMFTNKSDMEKPSEKVQTRTGLPSLAGLGESMKDSMSETTENNDNSLLPNADAITDESGALEAQRFKKLYQRGQEETEDPAE